VLLTAVQIEECDKDKQRALKKVLAEHTSKSKMKEKMLVRTENITFFLLSLLHGKFGMNSCWLKHS